MPERIKLTLAYDGSAYVGWQLQPNGISIQHCIEEALFNLSGERVRVHSSGRTDAGVHARGMVCHFDTGRLLPLTAWCEGLNRFLPEDIAVRVAEKVPGDFHARYSARSKHYRYTILRDPLPSPLDRLTSWRVKAPLDLELMRQACKDFCGVHDFGAFRSAGCGAETTVREIFTMSLEEDSGSLLHVDVIGSGFLRHMVRMMVGTLVEVGRCRRSLAILRSMLADPANAPAAVTAPAQGLCLMRVFYEEKTGQSPLLKVKTPEKFLDRSALLG